MAREVEQPLGTEHLLAREVVLASHGDFYATDQRIIRYEVRRNRERVEAITYEQLDGLVNVVAPRVQTVVLGALVVFLAVLVGPDGIAEVIFTGLGLAGMLAGFFNRRSYLEFRSAAFDPKTQRRWRLGADAGSRWRCAPLRDVGCLGLGQRIPHRRAAVAAPQVIHRPSR